VILVDSSVWIGHVRSANMLLDQLLKDRRILGHPLVTGEIAMGSLKGRQDFLELLDDLPQATESDHGEVRILIETAKLFSLGIGYLDMHLLTSVRLTEDAKLWTRDRRLHDAAIKLGIAWDQDRPR
jgi:predicted nucleic acid-binding protein